MDHDIILGIIVIAVAYALTLFLILWCRRMIDHIAPRNNGSLREILKEMKHGK